LVINAAVAQSPATITDLGTLGGSDSYAYGINASGQVTGTSSYPGVFATSHAFLYSGGVMRDIGFLGSYSGSISYGQGINASGQVAGFSYYAPNSANRHAFLYSGGTMRDLGTLGGANSYGQGINDSGQIAGFSDLPGTDNQHAFLYSGGAMRDLGTMGGFFSIAYGINDSGQVVGYADTPGNPGNLPYHAFLYSSGVMRDLGTLGGPESVAYGINASGQVVGFAATSHDLHAFLYSSGVMRDLGTLGGSTSYAYGINASGQVVGYSDTPNNVPHAFSYSGGVMTDLNSLLPANSGWVLTQATSINDSGQIVGYGIINGQTHAYLMNTQAISVDLSAVPSSNNWSLINTAYDPQFVVADAFGGVHTFPAQAILSSAPPGVHKAAYFALNTNPLSGFGTPAAQFNIALQQIGTEFANLQFIALDVEVVMGVNYPNDANSVTLRNQWINEAIEQIQSANKTPLIYTRRTDWATITGGVTSFGCVPLWDINLDGVPDLNNDGPNLNIIPSGPVTTQPWHPFGGWAGRVGKQYLQEVPPTGVDLDVFSPALLSSNSSPLASDMTSNVQISRSGFRLNHGSPSQYAQTVTITNLTSAPIPAPVSLVLDGLTSNATLANGAGLTSCTYPSNSPFVYLQQGAPLNPGQSALVILDFNNPTNQGISYLPRVLAGPGTR
jgi:probable HAF family extracellular repeat protein